MFQPTQRETLPLKQARCPLNKLTIRHHLSKVHGLDSRTTQKQQETSKNNATSAQNATLSQLLGQKKETVEDKKSHGDAPTGSSNRWLFTPIMATQRRNSTCKITECVTGIVLTYTVNEFVSPRVKFLPKAAPVDCALLPFTLTRHFLFLVWRAPAREEEAPAM